MTAQSPEPTPNQKRRARAANKQADEQAEVMDQTVTEKDDLPDEREEWFRAPGLRRMQMDFSPADRAVMDRMHSAIEKAVFEEFADAWAIMSRLWDIVREPEINEATGEIATDPFGFKIWKKDPLTQSYIEDWSQLTLTQQRDFLFEITTRIFEWEQRKERLWTNAMFSKAIFTERFAIEYDAPMSGTIDDRNAVANSKAAEDRYFALMQTSVSRRADAIVRTMNSLMLRLRDALPD